MHLMSSHFQLYQWFVSFQCLQNSFVWEISLQIISKNLLFRIIHHLQIAKIHRFWSATPDPLCRVLNVRLLTDWDSDQECLNYENWKSFLNWFDLFITLAFLWETEHLMFGSPLFGQKVLCVQIFHSNN